MTEQRAEPLVKATRFIDKFRPLGGGLLSEDSVTDFEKAFGVLHGASVEFIVVGGVAGALHSSAFITQIWTWFTREAARTSAV